MVAHRGQLPHQRATPDLIQVGVWAEVLAAGVVRHSAPRSGNQLGFPPRRKVGQSAVGLAHEKTIEALPRQHLMLFIKREPIIVR